MTTQGRPIPVEMQSLWQMSDPSFGNAEAAFRAWFDYTSRLQEHAMKLMSGHLAKSTAAVAQLRNCTSPMAALNVQLAYLSGTYADFMDEGQKMVGFMHDVANEGVDATSAEGASSTSGKAKPAQHRRSAH